MSEKVQNLQPIITRLLKPLVRLFLRRGLRLQEMLDALKRATLEVAEEDLKLSGEKYNFSRLSIVSGLQRKEIKRLISTSQQDYSTSNLLTRVIGQWQSNPEFLDADGGPKDLRVSGADSEFAQLVRSISNDVSPYTVLFGLEQSKTVVRKGAYISLINQVYIPNKNVSEALSVLAEDSNDLLRAVESNIYEKPSVPNLHLTTIYDNICLDSLDELREWILDQGTDFHEKLRIKLSKYDKDANPRLYKKQGGVRIAVCAFSNVSITNQSILSETEKSSENK